MAQKLDINTTYRMRSGYDIPALGYGVLSSSDGPLHPR